MIRIAGYLVGLTALAFLILNARFRFVLDTKVLIVAVLIVLVAIPIGCVLDFLGRRKRIPPGVPVRLLRVTALVAWVPIALMSLVGMLLYINNLPEPLAKQGPDTKNARGALIQRFGAGSDAIFRNAYYFCDPTFTGSSFEFLSFDYADKTDLLRRLGGIETLSPASPSDCQFAYAPSWWPRSTTGITSAFRFRSNERLCLEEAHHRAHILVIGH